MARYLVKPTRYDDENGREQKVYLIFDLDYPAFDAEMRLKPKIVCNEIPARLSDFYLAPIQVIPLAQMRRYFSLKAE
jgi:hypothetical protein